jgi:hypothetical protein
MVSNEVSAFPGATAIGRYFTVVSLVPSGVFIAYLVLLVRSGAWGHGQVDFAAAIGKLNLRDLAVFSVGSLLLATAIHPLQFVIIQSFEGFWGASRLAARLAVWNVGRHRRRAAALHIAGRTKIGDARLQTQAEPDAARLNASRQAVMNWLTGMEAWRQYGNYPHQRQDVMPTRLGNVLRRYEQLAGLPYGLDSIATVPRLLQVADARDVAYVHNQRMQMELALRMSALALVATPMTLAFMWWHGPWLLLGLAPYAVAYLTYRGAVAVAHEYGTSLAVAIELNRFTLYERLRLPLPEDLEEERENNQRLTALLRLDNVDLKARLAEGYLDYVHPAKAATEAGSKATPPAEKTDSGTRSEPANAEEKPTRQ